MTGMKRAALKAGAITETIAAPGESTNPPSSRSAQRILCHGISSVQAAIHEYSTRRSPPGWEEAARQLENKSKQARVAACESVRESSLLSPDWADGILATNLRSVCLTPGACVHSRSSPSESPLVRWHSSNLSVGRLCVKK